MPIRKSGRALTDRPAVRLALVTLASVIMAVNIKSFVEAGGLFPGGFNGLTLLIQRSLQQFAGVTLPFSLINFLLNAIPAIVSFRLIGKRFTLYSCLMIVLTSVLTDVIPSMPLTDDVLLICIFGGIINGFAISLCLLGRATSGGTDFIAVAVSERMNVDAWNYVLLGNAAMLAVAGFLFGWDKALYSIIFQYASTQVIRLLYRKYQQMTLFIVSEKYEDVYRAIRDITAHSATILDGTGGYSNTKKKMIYSVVSSQEAKQVVKAIRQLDDKAFINQIQTKELDGRFIYRD